MLSSLFVLSVQCLVEDTQSILVVSQESNSPLSAFLPLSEAEFVSCTLISPIVFALSPPLVFPPQFPLFGSHQGNGLRGCDLPRHSAFNFPI